MLKNRQLNGIQATRGIASLLIVLFHATALSPLPQYLNRKVVVGNFFLFGHAGVDIFFVLSGFIVFYVHTKDIGTGKVGLYWTKRMLRIMPPFYAACLFAVWIDYLRPWSVFHGRDEIFNGLVSSLLFFPDTTAILNVAWTLRNEFIFYSFFSLFIFNRKLGLVLLAVWPLTIIWFNFVDTFSLSSLSNDSLIRSLLNVRNIEFILGGITATISTKFPIRHPYLIFTAGLSLFFGNGVYDNYFRHILPMSTATHLMLFGFASTLMILGLATAELQSYWNQSVFRVPRALSFLGDASYSVYLTHFPVLGLIMIMLNKYGTINIISVPVLFLASIVITVAVGCAFYLIIEKPMLQYSYALVERLGQRGSNRNIRSMFRWLNRW